MAAPMLPRGSRRVLISTISPESGGIPANLRFVTRTLRARGYEPVLAHYEPYSVSPHLSVPSFRLLRRRVGNELRHALDGFETHAIGAWLPELEFTHYLATAAWQRVDGQLLSLPRRGWQRSRQHSLFPDWASFPRLDLQRLAPRPQGSGEGVSFGAQGD